MAFESEKPKIPDSWKEHVYEAISLLRVTLSYTLYIIRDRIQSCKFLSTSFEKPKNTNLGAACNQSKV